MSRDDYVTTRDAFFTNTGRLLYESWRDLLEMSVQRWKHAHTQEDQSRKYKHLCNNVIHCYLEQGCTKTLIKYSTKTPRYPITVQIHRHSSNDSTNLSLLNQSQAPSQGHVNAASRRGSQYQCSNVTMF